MDIQAPFKPLINLVCLLFMIFVLSLAGGSVYAQETGSSNEPGQTKGYDEAEALSIDRMLMCPVCPAETIDQAQVPIAKQMRQLVRDKLSEGEGRDQILDYFAGVYGNDILAAPGKSGVNLVAWTVPIAGMLAALAAVFFVLRAMSARPSGETAGGSGGPLPAEDALAPYLDAIDRELALPESRPNIPDGVDQPETGPKNGDQAVDEAGEGHG